MGPDQAQLGVQPIGEQPAGRFETARHGSTGLGAVQVVVGVPVDGMDARPGTVLAVDAALGAYGATPVMAEIALYP